MQQNKYYPPVVLQKEFHCPYCKVYASQKWGIIRHNAYGYNDDLQNWKVSLCAHCDRVAIWHQETMIYPAESTAPFAHEDMPESITSDYNEARSIVGTSPRGAAALLRLALQKLMVELGESGKDINADIGSLVKKGLPVEVQQSLDILRVIGNESVHPGTFDLRDDTETAITLFELINFIIDDRITQKKKIAALYSKLPPAKLKGIEDRDKERTT